MSVLGVQRRLPFSRGQLTLVGALLVLALVGWLITDRRMAGMDAGPGTDLGTLGFYTSAWVVMMAAMMFPSMWPMVLGYRFVAKRRAELGHTAEAGSTTLFVIGYLAVWTLFGLLAYAVFDGLKSLSIDVFSWHRGGPYLAGAVLVVAAAYQLTPAKDVCLTRCRTPFHFLTESWREGRLGAARMGAVHGAWCVGCCWALMAVLFALGIMSVGWMLFVAAVIAAEKLLPWKVQVNRVVAIVLAALGAAVAFTPSNVPGLTIPDSPAAQRAMMKMSGSSAMRMKSGSSGMQMKSGPQRSSGMQMKSRSPRSGMQMTNGSQRASGMQMKNGSQTQMKSGSVRSMGGSNSMRR